MFIAVLFLPVVAGNVFTENSPKRVPEVTERSWEYKTYTIFDPCNKHKPGGRAVSCSQLLMMGHNKSSEYNITPGDTTITVYCDMKTDGGGWTVIQRRDKHEESETLFDKTYEEYENGFGETSASHWIGNTHLHTLTTHPNKKQALRIEMNSSNQGKNYTVNYGVFTVGSKEVGYKMNSWDTDNKEYDALAFTNGKKFVIGNIENIYHYGNCYGLRSGGWWSDNYCTFTNLNGHRRDPRPGKPTPTLDITWFRGLTPNGIHVYIFGKVEMKIRDADFGFCTGRMASSSP